MIKHKVYEKGRVEPVGEVYVPTSCGSAIPENELVPVKEFRLKCQYCDSWLPKNKVKCPNCGAPGVVSD